MKSKLFKRLADLPGVSWFNHNEKVETPPPNQPLPPVESESAGAMYRQSIKYFSSIVRFAQIIKVQKELIDSYDFEVEKWDMIQAAHEEELKQRDDQIKSLKGQVRAIENRKLKTAISTKDVDKLIDHLTRISVLTTHTKDKAVRRANEMHRTLHQFLQKLKAHSDIEQ